ncbi:MAG: V-type ATPase subunit [Candidatus Gygaella obscura]|nr:V-type ATPase subunit [Candidatus Gygaella obscura]
MNNAPSVYDYAYGVGKIRALEKSLITEEAFKEALNLNLEEALHLFVEPGIFSEDLIGVENSADLELVLSKEKESLRKIVNQLLPDKSFICLVDLDNLSKAKEKVISIKSEFLQDYILHLIDMHNIKTFLRSFIFKRPLEELRSLISETGFIDRKDFFALYEKELSFFLARLEFVHKKNSIINYSLFLKEAVKEIEKNKSFIELERSIAGFLIDILRPAKYISFGPEAVIAYFFARVNEINMVRLIVLGKINSVETNLLYKRLNSTYV